jgi:replication initiator protein RepSA
MADVCQRTELNPGFAWESPEPVATEIRGPGWWGPARRVPSPRAGDLLPGCIFRQTPNDHVSPEAYASPKTVKKGLSACFSAKLSVTVDSAIHTGDTASAESESLILRFGNQIDTQPLTAAGDATTLGLTRRVAAYLAKYTTKSVAEFGIAARRISTAAIAELDIPAHTRRILFALADLAKLPGNAAMLGWLHTLGYRGHITTKSRRYSVTMAALHAARHRWRMHRADKPERDCPQHNSHDEQGGSSSAFELSYWRIDGAGHRNDGERLLVHTAALRAREYRYLARLDAGQHSGASP